MTDTPPPIPPNQTAIAQIKRDPNAPPPPPDHLTQYTPLRDNAAGATAHIGALVQADRELSAIKRETIDDGVWGDERYRTRAAQVMKRAIDSVPVFAQQQLKTDVADLDRLHYTEVMVGNAANRAATATNSVMEGGGPLANDYANARTPLEARLPLIKFNRLVSVAEQGGLMSPEQAHATRKAFLGFAGELKQQAAQRRDEQQQHLRAARNRALEEKARSIAAAAAPPPRPARLTLPGMPTHLAGPLRLAFRALNKI